MGEYDHIAETDDGRLEFFDAEGNSLGIFDSVKDYEQAAGGGGEQGSEESGDPGEVGAEEGETGDNAKDDIAGDDAGGSAASGGATTGDDEEGNEQAGDTGGVKLDETGNSVSVENWPSDYVTTAQLAAVAEDLTVVQGHMEVMSAGITVLVVLVAAVLGAVAVQTLVRSFENW